MTALILTEVQRRDEHETVMNLSCVNAGDAVENISAADGHPLNVTVNRTPGQTTDFIFTLKTRPGTGPFQLPNADVICTFRLVQEDPAALICVIATGTGKRITTVRMRREPSRMSQAEQVTDLLLHALDTAWLSETAGYEPCTLVQVFQTCAVTKN